MKRYQILERNFYKDWYEYYQLLISVQAPYKCKVSVAISEVHQLISADY